MLVIKCDDEQVFYMSAGEFDPKGELENLFFCEDGKFFAVINPQKPEDLSEELTLEEFLSFVQKDFFYSKFFKVKFFRPDIRGFTSLAQMEKVIEEYHNSQSKFYVEGGEIENIRCLGGLLFTPLIEDDKTLEDFWHFVFKRSSHRECCKRWIEVGDLKAW